MRIYTKNCVVEFTEKEAQKISAESVACLVKLMTANEPVRHGGLAKAAEFCPHCGHENVFLWDVRSGGYIFRCLRCGKPVLLCSVCEKAENECDWHGGKCSKTNGRRIL